MTEREKLLIDKYLPAFLAFSIKKLGNISEAEELAQEIAYQAMLAINSGRKIDKFDPYMWSIAHNTFKNWCARKRTVSFDENFDSFSNILAADRSPLEQAISSEEKNTLRLALSKLTKEYRESLVYFYYEDLSIKQIAKKLSLTEGMVKFYLRAGKEKLKEAIIMKEVGKKSFMPDNFTVYKSGIDFSRINVWEIFKRKLPCQIAIICHDQAKTISQISIETGTPSVYIEDEINILLDSGLIISPVRNKYRTNFHILKEEEGRKIKDKFMGMYENYLPKVKEIFESSLAHLKEVDIFKFPADKNQWAWFFASQISSFNYTDYGLVSNDYPQILSCGSKSFIFAQMQEGSIWGAGSSPTFLKEATVYGTDIIAFGPYRRQRELADKEKAQALYDIYQGLLNEEDKHIYAKLIEEGYIIKKDGLLYCNIAVSNKASRQVIDSINDALLPYLKNFSREIRSDIAAIVKASLPSQLKDYEKGFVETWISFLSGVYFREALYGGSFLAIPEESTPIASWIYEK